MHCVVIQVSIRRDRGFSQVERKGERGGGGAVGGEVYEETGRKTKKRRKKDIRKENKRIRFGGKPLHQTNKSYITRVGILYERGRKKDNMSINQSKQRAETPSGQFIVPSHFCFGWGNGWVWVLEWVGGSRAVQRKKKTMYGGM